jgi:hypothetical protein
MSCGAVVVTNLDEHSPSAFQHGVNLLDIARCDALPLDPSTLTAMGGHAEATATVDLGWSGLIAAMAGPDGSLAVSRGRGVHGQ